MRWILIKIEERMNPVPTLCLTWGNGISEITEYHSWTSYPVMPDWRLLAPGILHAQRGTAFFKAPIEFSAQDICHHNLNHYLASPQSEDAEKLEECTEIEKLEKAAEEINEASDQRYLYWPR